MDFSSQLKNNIKKIAIKHGLDIVLVFGSVVTNKTHQGSDIDIAIRYKDSNPEIISKYFKDFGDIHFGLQKLFPEYEVDLVLINHADPLFLKKITERSILLFGESKEFAELKIYAFKRYVDHRRYFEMEKRFVEKFLAERREKTA
jgi:predicted nucleotidyltransferase